MTIDEFKTRTYTMSRKECVQFLLDQISELNIDYQFVPNQFITGRELIRALNGQCPLCALASSLDGEFELTNIWKAFRIGEYSETPLALAMLDIMNAADLSESPYRSILLEMTNL